MMRGGLVSGSEIRADLLQLEVPPDRAWVSDIFCCLADPCASTASGIPLLRPPILSLITLFQLA